LNHDLLQARGIYDKLERARLVGIACEEQIRCDELPSAAAWKAESSSCLPGVETVWALNMPDTEDNAKRAIQQVSGRLLELTALLGAQQGDIRRGTGADLLRCCCELFMCGRLDALHDISTTFAHLHTPAVPVELHFRSISCSAQALVRTRILIGSSPTQSFGTRTDTLPLHCLKCSGS
jgi:hypothetical protein